MRSRQKALTAVVILAAAVLQACGGDDDERWYDPWDDEYSFTEFEGTWKYVGDECKEIAPATRTSSALYASDRGSTLRIDERSGEFVFTTPIYSDRFCTYKQGDFYEYYRYDRWATGFRGRDNVYRVELTFHRYDNRDLGSRTMERVEDAFGSAPSGRQVSRILLDVDGYDLYVGDDESRRDSDGYPTKFYSDPSFTR